MNRKRTGIFKRCVAIFMMLCMLVSADYIGVLASEAGETQAYSDSESSKEGTFLSETEPDTAESISQSVQETIQETEAQTESESDTGGESETEPQSDALILDAPVRGASTRATKTVVIQKNWNDNHDALGKRPEFPADAKEAQALLGIKLCFSIDGSEPAEITDANKAQLGLDAVPAAKMASNTSFNTWALTFMDLPADVDGKTITYSAIETKVPDDYISSRIDETQISNTVKETIELTVDWRDNENGYATRPNVSAFLGALSLYRNGEQVTLQSADSTKAAYIEYDAGSMKLKVTNIPKYDAAGEPYTYTVKQSALQIASDNTLTGSDKDVSYEAVYENIGNHALDTDALYNGGTLKNTLVGSLQFEGTKVWQDDGSPETVAARPSIAFDLYRYQNINDFNYTNGAPVPEVTKMLVTPVEGSVFNYKVSAELTSGIDTLPRFDEEGHEYVYYAKETLSGGQAAYEKIFKNTVEVDGSSSYLFQNGTIYNRRTGTAGMEVVKVWEAAARQSMHASVSLIVEGRQKGNDTAEWEPVLDGSGKPMTVTMEGFFAEQMTQSVNVNLPQYDSNGLEYEYRIRENAVVIDGTAAEVIWKADRLAGGETGSFTYGGDEYEVTAEVEPDTGKLTVTNRLVGKKTLKIIKIWDPEIPGDASLKFHVFDHKGAEIPNSPYTMSGKAGEESSWILEIPDLPKYDEHGALIQYTVTEEAYSNTNGIYDIDYTYQYSKDGNEETVTVKNSAPGEGQHIRVRKVWLDDGDTEHRAPVTVQVFRASDNSPLEGASAELNVGNNWEAKIGIPKDDSADDYYIRETKLGTHEVVYRAKSIPGAVGSVDTDYHLYEVTTLKNNANDYTVTNKRIGTLSVDVSKKWIDGHDAVRPKVTFSLYQNGVVFSSITLDGQTDEQGEVQAWSAHFPDLPKYDDNGALYSYTVKEDENVITADVGTTTLAALEYQSSLRKTGYEVGNNHTNDKITYEAVNQKSATISDFIVHKIWLDNGTERRPDVTLTLYRDYTDKDGNPVKAEVVTPYVDRTWDAEYTKFHWSCSFANLPKYSPDGCEYTYYVVEKMAAPGDYKARYYAAEPNESGTIDLNANIRSEERAENHETIVNYRAYERTINGVKIWSNIPAGVLKTRYPTAVISLFRIPYKEDGIGKTALKPIEQGEAVLSGGQPLQVLIKNGATAYSFKNLPKYDDYGRKIHYFVKEAEINGFAKITPQDGTFRLTNIYTGGVPIEITVEKDFSNIPAGTAINRYPKVTMKLYRWMQDSDGNIIDNTKEEVDTQTISITGGEKGSCTFNNPDKASSKYAANGLEYIYKVVETQVNGYDKVADSYPVAADSLTNKASVSINNSYTGGDIITLSGKKQWDDQQNKYGLRPEKADIKFELWRSDGVISEQITDAVFTWDSAEAEDKADEWCFKVTTTSTKLYMYAPNGKAYEYTVKEAAGGIKGYNENGTKEVSAKASLTDKSSAAYTVSLSNKLDTTEISINKKWQYDDGSDIPYESGSFGLFNSTTQVTFEISDTANTVREEQTVTGDALKNGKLVFNKLPKYDKNGNNYVYKVTEKKISVKGTEATLSGITLGAFTVSGNEAANGGTITNECKAVSIKIQKIWDDSDNIDGIRPAEVQYKITAEAESGNSGAAKGYILKKPDASTDKNAWPVSDQILVPKYAIDGITAQSYQVEETVPTKYVSNPDTGGMSQPVVTAAASTELSEGSVTSRLYTFKNVHTPDMIKVKASKQWKNYGWDAYQSESVQVQLYKIVGINKTEVGSPVTLNKDSWSYEWTELPVHAINKGYQNVSNLGQAVPITYRIEECRPPGQYESTPAEKSAVTASDGTLLLELVNELKTTSVSVQKEWKDGGNAYNTRPKNGEVTVELQYKKESEGSSAWKAVEFLSDSGQSVQQTLTTDESSQRSDVYKWENLPKISQGDGQEPLVYRVVEKKMGDTSVTDNKALGYTVTYSAQSVTEGQITIQNSLPVTEYTVEKRWEDENNKYTIRPDSVTVALQRRIKGDTSEASWQQVDEKVIKEGPQSDWKCVFENLPSMAPNFKAYEYRAVETKIGSYNVQDELSGYTMSECQYQEKGAVITNKLVTVNISGEKQWADDSDRYGFRPEAITLKILMDSGDITDKLTKEQITWDKSGGDCWTYTVSGLPKYNASHQKAVYTAAEGNVENYTGEVLADGLSFKNTLVSGSLTVQKIQIGGAASEFEFKVKLTGEKSDYGYYNGTYTVTDTQGAETEKTAGNGVLRIAGGEKFTIKGIPDNTAYEVTELGHQDFELKSESAAQGTIHAGAISEAEFTNEAYSEVEINNTTPNPSVDYEGGNTPTDTGGKVTVITDESPEPDKPDKDDYKKNKIQVTWKPNTYWNFGSAFEVQYRKASSDSFTGVAVHNYLNGDGSLKPANDSVYDDLRKVYPDFEIELKNGAVLLTLAADAGEMPRQTRVDVDFTPTLAVYNTTDNYAGGTVAVSSGVENEKTDGVDSIDGHSRYTDVSAYGRAKDGYRVDMSKLTIGYPGSIKGSAYPSAAIEPDASGRFTVTVKAVVNDKLTDVRVSGIVAVKKDADGQPVEIEIALDKLPVPLDIGIAYDKIPEPDDTTDTSDTTDTTDTSDTTDTTDTIDTSDTTGTTDTADTPDTKDTSGNPQKPPHSGTGSNGIKTGDNAPIAASALMLLVSGLFIAGVLLKKKR